MTEFSQYNEGAQLRLQAWLGDNDFVLTAEREDGAANWYKAYRNRSSNEVVRIISTRNELDLGYGIEGRNSGTVPDIWLNALNNSPILCESRNSFGYQVKVLMEFRDKFVALSKRADFETLIDEAGRRAVEALTRT